MWRPLHLHRHGAAAIATSLLLFLGSILPSAMVVEGTASDKLLGGEYSPSTDVDYILELTDVLTAIAKEPGQPDGEMLYKEVVPDGISLEQIFIDAADARYLNQNTNPWYSLYMYGYWRSRDGSGADNGGSQKEGEALSAMKFLEKRVTEYGHTIIRDEFTKSSGYDPELTAETIRVMSMWMATLQSLYDSAAFCDDEDFKDGTWDSAKFVSPVDKAAAFWFGDADAVGAQEGGSLYAWTERTRLNFTFNENLPASSPSSFNANKELVTGFKKLQTLLGECMGTIDPSSEYGFVSDEVLGSDVANKMRVTVEEMRAAMMIPVVQNMIHRTAVVGLDGSSATRDDYMILYGLAASPPIRICDKVAFESLYTYTVHDAKNMNEEKLYDMLTSLYSRLPCLGITCAQIGSPTILEEEDRSGSNTWPSCPDPMLSVATSGYYPVTAKGLLFRMLKLDLDVQTIGSLIQMEAPTAAYDVYTWGMHVMHKEMLTLMGVYPSLQSWATSEYHESNKVGRAYNDFMGISETAANNWDDYHEYKVMMGRDEFTDATSTQRRIIAESSMVLITLHAFAVNCMYKALDACNDSKQNDHHWDMAYASLTGWAEEDEHARGFLMLEVARFLCEDAGKCVVKPDDASVNVRLLKELESGKKALNNLSCTVVEDTIPKIEKLILTILVDFAAYFAERMAVDPDLLNEENLAEGYGAAIALVPLMRDVDATAAGIVEENMGVFGNSAAPLSDGKEAVLTALQSFVGSADIECGLLTDLRICPNGDVTATVATSAATITSSTMATATPADDTIETSTMATSTPADNTLDKDDGDVQCSAGIHGGMPISLQASFQIAPLLGGAYMPTSNVDHVVQLTRDIELIEKTESEKQGLDYYTQMGEDGVSLRCLSTASLWEYITDTNPLYLIYMYGLWISDLGDNGSDGYSNKVFDGKDILYYGDTIVMDEFDKQSGYNPKLTAETIRVMNMWMSMSTEMYRAVETCRNGYSTDAPADFNPVDFAAALWLGSAENPDLTVGGSLYAWAKRAEQEYTDQSDGVNDKIIELLKKLQQDFSDCRSLFSEQEPVYEQTEGKEIAIRMKQRADEISRWMLVPMVQWFIHHLAAKSGGLVDESDSDERNELILYSLAVLPFISVCDEETFDDLFSDLITNIESYDTSTFFNHLEVIYSRLDCLGISCDMVGTSIHIDNSWPDCKPHATTTKIGDYQPSSDSALQILKFDLDISTILSFIVMEANHAALDVYENGRNVVNGDGGVSLSKISVPESDPTAIEIYEGFTGSGADNYLRVTKDAISGDGEFGLTSPLINSAAASLAMATIDMHLSVIDDIHQAIRKCDTEGWEDHWDSAIAATVGWTEVSGDGSSIEGYLFYQLAEELCSNFDTCINDGDSLVNIQIMDKFKMGQEKLKNNECGEAAEVRDDILKLLQALLVDSLAYHSKVAVSSDDERHCLLAHVTRNAIVPLIKPIASLSAQTIDSNVGGFTNGVSGSISKCSIGDVDAIYSALNKYVVAKGIDCSLLGSSVCSGSSSGSISDMEMVSQDDTPTVSDGNLSLFNGEYDPITDVTKLHGISTVVSSICEADDTDKAKTIYSKDETAGIIISAMSTGARYAMKDELQFNQFVFGLHDSVDKTDGSFLFDSRPAEEYGNTITNDAIDTKATLGCMAAKVLNIWMWIIHKLNDAISGCRDRSNDLDGSIDEAAALWEGSQLFEMANTLGPSFGHSEIGGMSFLNRQIVDRFIKARNIVANNDNNCDYTEVHDLRIIVKETISYMTAVLIQCLIDAMLDDTNPSDRREITELMAFATVPHIKKCGHEVKYDYLYKILITEFKEDGISDALSVLQNHYNCLGLTCSDIGRHDKETSAHPKCSDNMLIVGYTPVNETKTNMISKIDLDAVAIHQMMAMEKYDVAKRIYQEGHNYYDYDNKEDYNFVSVHNLTQSHTIDYVDFDTYREWNDKLKASYGSYEIFADKLIVEAFDGTGDIYHGTTAIQRDLAVNVAISSLVSYMSALQALYFSSSVCKDETEASITAFDGAAALLVGSVEGRGPGGNLDHEGKMMYSITKQACDHFGTCRGGDSAINVKIFRALKEGQGFIKSQSCDAAAHIVDKISSYLKSALVQNLLYFTDSSVISESDNDIAAYFAAVATFPFLDEIDETSATTIRDTMDFRKATAGDESKGAIVRAALDEVLSNPKTPGVSDCDYESFGFACRIGNNVATPGSNANTPVAPIQQEKPMKITNGLYVASSYVGDRTAIAIDVQRIRESLESSDVARATDYYNKGQNSKIFDENGLDTGEKRSIAKFSLESKDTMKAHPMYNLFVFGLSDRNQEFLGKPATLYADSFINHLLTDNPQVAADAMVAVTIWMEVAHSLHSAHGACKLSYLADGRNIDGRRMQTRDPALLIDEAAAYWIGDNQAAAGSAEGHLLYALTESIGSKFEDIADGSESEINTKVIDLFNKAKSHIAISRDCSTSSESHLKLKEYVDELMPLMAIPLIRNLLYYLNTDNPAMVQVYAVAVLPLFSACSPSTYKELKTMLIDHIMLEVIQKEYVYSKIQSLYSCLGLTCELVGSLKQDDFSSTSGTFPHCDTSNLQSLAGYRYTSDVGAVGAHSLIDVDIRKVEILINNGAKHFPDSQEALFGAAFDIYKYGTRSNAVKISLSSMARDTNRDITPVFGAFRRYFERDDNYADTLIEFAFQKKVAFEYATAEQRKRVILFLLKYMVTYMSILEKLYSSVQSCKQKKDAFMDLDTAAAYFIGSLEGKEDGGSHDGNLIFMLAKRMCVLFRTCTSDNTAMVNERILELLYASQGEAEIGACDSLERTVKEIENALIIPLIQGVISSARENELYSKNLSEAEFYPEGYALALSILPIIDDVDTSAAKDLADVMVNGFPGSGRDAGSNDAAKVQRAIRDALSKMDEVGCSDIGAYEGSGFCPGDGEFNSAIRSQSSLIAPVAIGSALFVAFHLF